MATTFFLSSCIKDEPKNLEADIVNISPKNADFFVAPSITDNRVVVYFKSGNIDIKKVALNLQLTPGAVAVPASGQELDYTDGIEYTVTSENGEFSKKYMVNVVVVGNEFVPTFFDFESVEIDEENKFNVFYNTISGQRFYNLASGNGGFAVSLMFDPSKEMKPEAYPTSATTESHSGQYAALLETKLTGTFGAMFKKPIAAGNLFIGTFDTQNAVVDALGATHFGFPFNKVPVAIEGYYKYKAGENKTDQNLKPLASKDSCDIYAVLYNRKELLESSKGKVKVGYLTGKNVLTDPSVVAIARLADGGSTAGNDFKKFTLPFVFKKDVDYAAIEKLDYNIAIVFSSSKDGDKFHGAVGSKLIVDDVKIVTK